MLLLILCLLHQVMLCERIQSAVLKRSGMSYHGTWSMRMNAERGVMQDGGYHVPFAHKSLASGLDLESYTCKLYECASIQTCTPKQQPADPDKRLGGYNTFSTSRLLLVQNPPGHRVCMKILSKLSCFFMSRQDTKKQCAGYSVSFEEFRQGFTSLTEPLKDNNLC